MHQPPRTLKTKAEAKPRLCAVGWMLLLGVCFVFIVFYIVVIRYHLGVLMYGRIMAI